MARLVNIHTDIRNFNRLVLIPRYNVGAHPS